MTLWICSLRGIWHANLILYSLSVWNLLETFFCSTQTVRNSWFSKITDLCLSWRQNITSGFWFRFLSCILLDSWFIICSNTRENFFLWPLHLDVIYLVLCSTILIFTFWGSCWPGVSFIRKLRPMILRSILVKFSQ